MDTFTEFVRDQLTGLKGLEMKRMFGGYGLYLGPAFIGILFEGKLFFKTNQAPLPKYKRLESKPFEYQKKSKKVIRMKHYYQVPVEILEDSKRLKQWAMDCLASDRRTV